MNEGRNELFMIKGRVIRLIGVTEAARLENYFCAINATVNIHENATEILTEGLV